MILLLLTVTCRNTFAQWTQTNGPLGITVSTFLNVNDSILLCGTNARGVMRSYDHGHNWSNSNTGIENNYIDCFAMDSVYIYAGSFESGIYRSSDKGLTWQPVNIGMQNEAVSNIVIGGGYIFAGTVLNGVYRSGDHGNTWTNINQGLLDFTYIIAMVYCNNRLIVEGDNYLFFSDDNGNSWNTDQGSTAFYSIDHFFQHGDTLLASVGIIYFRSIDGGHNWGPANIMTHSFVGFDHIGDTVYAGTRDGLYSSTDFGVTWNFSPALLRQGTRELDGFVISNGKFLLGYGEIGIYISDDTGSTWSQVPLNQFPVGSTIDDAITFANGTIYSGTHSDGVYSTLDGGNSWSRIGTPNEFDTLSNEIIFSILHVDQNIVLAGGCGTGLFRSGDNGNTWTHITNGLPADSGNFTCIKTLAICGPNILAALTTGVYYSTDSGVTWLPTSLTTGNILQTGGFAIRGNIACVGVIATPAISATGVYRSTDYGINWTMAENIPDIETMATGGNHVMYAGELFSSYVSLDDGLTWNGLGLGAAFSILAFDNFAFIGNNDGVFFSDNYGATWTLQNTGFFPAPHNVVMGLTRDSNYIYAGTERNGIWKRPLADFGIVTSISSAELNKHNFSIYPNPVNGIINIYLSDEEENSIIRIVNPLNETVTLIKTFGKKSLHADLSFLPDGIYTAVFETWNNRDSEKFVLMSHY
jgi:photosystem II stability/assembly factor-like uncharacterized protein